MVVSVFPTGAAAIRKDWQLAGVNMPIVNSVAFKEELHYMLEAVYVPGMARMKLTLLAHKYFLLLGHIPLLLDSLMYFIFLSQFCGLMVYFSSHYVDQCSVLFNNFKVTLQIKSRQFSLFLEQWHAHCSNSPLF